MRLEGLMIGAGKNLLLATPVLALIFAIAILSGCSTDRSPQQQAQDLRITSEVKAGLAEKLQVATVTNVDVSTTNGVVTLSGQVATNQEKSQAEEIARGIEGVSRVYNNLEIGGAPANGQPANGNR